MRSYVSLIGTLVGILSLQFAVYLVGLERRRESQRFAERGYPPPLPDDEDQEGMTLTFSGRKPIYIKNPLQQGVCVISRDGHLGGVAAAGANSQYGCSHHCDPYT